MKLKLTILIPAALILMLSTVFTALASPSQVLALPLPGLGTVNVSSVVTESFDQLNAWEKYSSPAGVELGVENGIYRAYTPNPGYVWGLNSSEQTDVVADVDVTPLTPFPDNGAGVMCRADISDNGNGYYFMINANGYASIQLGTDAGITPLVDWQPSKAIHTGIDKNTLRAVCMDDQLALYVNDELVASVTDKTYSSGYAGLAVAAGENGVDMSFDNLILYTLQTAGS